MSAFDTAISRILIHEGEFTNSPKDSGNWTSGKINVGTLKGTKYGISAASYPYLDIKNLTEAQAKEIYYKDYWIANKLNLLNPDLAYQVLDACIQHGSKKAIKFLQELVNETQDGVIGDKTLSSVSKFNQEDLAILYIRRRINFYTNLQSSKWSSFGLGLMRRMADNHKYLNEHLSE